MQRVEGVALLWPISVVTGRIDAPLEDSEFPYVRVSEASRGRCGPPHSGGARRRPVWQVHHAVQNDRPRRFERQGARLQRVGASRLRLIDIAGPLVRAHSIRRCAGRRKHGHGSQQRHCQAESEMSCDGHARRGSCRCSLPQLVTGVLSKPARIFDFVRIAAARPAPARQRQGRSRDSSDHPAFGFRNRPANPPLP